VLRVGIAQKAGAIARHGLIGEELDFENWAAVAIYHALALNHLVLHVDPWYLERALCNGREPAPAAQGRRSAGELPDYPSAAARDLALGKPENVILPLLSNRS
jgi:hypothetical protein